MMFTLLVEITCTRTRHNVDKNQPVKRDSKVYHTYTLYWGRNALLYLFLVYDSTFIYGNHYVHFTVLSLTKVILKG